VLRFKEMSDNPQAFPSLEIYEDYDRDTERYEVRSNSTAGMTLRDYFAAKALAGMCAISSTHMLNVDAQVNARHAAYAAYQYADAMLKERER